MTCNFFPSKMRNIFFNFYFEELTTIIEPEVTTEIGTEFPVQTETETEQETETEFPVVGQKEAAEPLVIDRELTTQPPKEEVKSKLTVNLLMCKTVNVLDVKLMLFKTVKLLMC
jgi:hypothetical protein